MKWSDMPKAMGRKLDQRDAMLGMVTPGEPVPPVEVLTPSEVALAKVLAAWETWRDAGEPDDETLFGVVCVLAENDFVSFGDVTAKGRALLDRARRAGVL